ncbi:MAG: hypothetical protein EZS28_021047 [Streblomastix strix]|uniref:Uncharacterized protein n=1 Tax=Streblomastix strix TaxID=222440 RepID=A0A5J4VLX8_9EUKA|nr:MAG: hypothetical protein EZS28_021047 [Streblomastix strix]
MSKDGIYYDICRIGEMLLLCVLDKDTYYLIQGAGVSEFVGETHGKGEREAYVGDQAYLLTIGDEKFD